MSEISEINMPTVIHVLGVSGISEKKNNGIFISDISDIQQLIYLCTCSESSVFFQDICLSTRVVFFFRIFRTLPGHVLQLAYLFQIFRTFSIWFICAHAPEVLHFLRTFTWAPGLIIFGYSAHSQEMYYIWHIHFAYFRHLAPKFICAHLADAMEVLHLSSTFIQAPGPHTVLNLTELQSATIWVKARSKEMERERF